MKKANETVVLCGASAYEEKYYLNPQFSKLPEHIRQELQITESRRNPDAGIYAGRSSGI